MGARESYTPGTFSWAELLTPDQDGAKRFYGELFGWQATDNPVGEDTVYSMMSLQGHRVAGIGPQPEQQRQAGVPPLWNNYVTVSSADDAAERAKELGANVHAGAFDVFDYGRMAVVQDPQGAFIMVWEPRQTIGAGLVNVPGALTWNELASSDPQAAQQFYGEWFGWSFEQLAAGDMPYWVIKTAAGASNGGVRALGPGEPAPYWLPYFAAAELNQSLQDAVRLGGRRLAGPMAVGAGEIAVLSDPAGAVFALYAGDLDD